MEILVGLVMLGFALVAGVFLFQLALTVVITVVVAIGAVIGAIVAAVFGEKA